jgi:hypothetical protein
MMRDVADSYRKNLADMETATRSFGRRGQETRAERVSKFDFCRCIANWCDILF